MKVICIIFVFKKKGNLNESSLKTIKSAVLILEKFEGKKESGHPPNEGNWGRPDEERREQQQPKAVKNSVVCYLLRQHCGNALNILHFWRLKEKRRKWLPWPPLGGRQSMNF